MSRDSRHTAVVQTTNGTSGLAIAGLIFSILGWFTLGLLCIPGAFLCLLALAARGPKSVAIAGLIVGFPGTLFFAFIGLGVVLGVLGLGAAAISPITEPDSVATAVPFETHQTSRAFPQDVKAVLSGLSVDDTPESFESQQSSNSPTKPSETEQSTTRDKVRPNDPIESASDSRPDSEIEAAKWRTWTSANGKYTLDAKFIKLAMGMLTLQKVDGSTVDVKLNALSSEDQEFVRKRKWRPQVSGVIGPRAKIVRARLVPYTAAGGTRTQMVLVDWRNTGTTAIAHHFRTAAGTG